MIVITIDKEIKFSKYDASKFDIKKSFCFSEDYIKKNINEISKSLNKMIIEKNINTAIIEELNIAETSLYLINKLNIIEKIKFLEEKSLNYTISSLLLENKNINKIICYGLPDVLFAKFENGVVETKEEILFFSDFMEINNINSSSKLFNAKVITIDCNLNNLDKEELKYFFDNNKDLKKIIIKNYKKEVLDFILDNINRRIQIELLENHNNRNNLIKDIEYFNKINKKNNASIKIKYSDEYTKKNRLNQLGLPMLRSISVIGILFSFIIFGLNYNNKKITLEKTESQIEVVQEIKEEIEDEIQVEQEDVVEEVLPIIDVQKEDATAIYYRQYNKLYNELLKINKDTVGWINVKNTKIDYPVVQTTDNNYYLTHDFENNKNIHGWVYVDYRNNLDNLDKNTIIYGHYTGKSNLMFTSLTNTLNESWYNNQDNLKITFNIKNQNIKWQIFSIYVIENTSDYLKVKFNTDAGYKEFLDMLKNRSIKDFNVDVNSDDYILTLSTCYKTSDYRLVVHAKKIN